MNALSERRGSFRPQPKNTFLYEVRQSDTLAGIAARYNITPSELTNLNKLATQTLFPGQIIYVPEVLRNCESESEVTREASQDAVEDSSPKPGHVERVSSAVDKNANEASIKDSLEFVHISPSQLAENLDKECLTKFLKINAKHITDGEGVVSGILLVTPNHLMFDPNVSDPLVIEHGVEKYGVVAPMHMIVRTALYPDIVRMKVKDAPALCPDGKKVGIYHSKSSLRKKVSAEIVEDELLNTCGQNNINFSERPRSHTTSSIGSTYDALSKICESIDDESLSEPSAIVSEWPNSLSSCELSNSSSEVTESVSVAVHRESEGSRTSTSSAPELAEIIENLPVLTTSLSQNFESSGRKSSSEDECVSLPIEEKITKKKNNFEKTKHKFQKGLRKLSISDGLFQSSSNHRRMSLPASVLSFTDLKNKSLLYGSSGKKTKSSEEKLQPESSGLSYVNMVEEKPELFTSLEKLLPRPAKSFDHAPLYLCLYMGKPIKKTVFHFTPVKDFGKKLKPEYWFSIPQERVDELYHFFMRWAPEKYGDIDDINLEELGYNPVCEEDYEDVPICTTNFPSGRRRSSWALPWKRRKSKDVTEITKVDDLSPVDWEFLSMESTQREPSVTESQISLPELLAPSSILSEEQIRKINELLPPRAVGYPWSLIYSTAVHGFSLKTMYLKMADYDTPILLVIANTAGAVFGAMLSCPLKISDHFYGTGETFLFTFCPEFKHFPWSGENHYFIKGNVGSFAVGASEGHFGLWLDDDLYHGCTKHCQTFANDSLCDPEDFVVNALEAWGFI